MYDDTIKVANKIISHDDLNEIFSKMYEKIVYWQKVYANEVLKNKVLDYKYKTWTFKDCSSHLRFVVNFYDDASIEFDNYNNFISVFNYRLDEIKVIQLYFRLNYDVVFDWQKSQSYNQYINMQIQEEKMSIDIRLSSDDRKIDDIYDLIKRKILNAPPKYDDIVRKKTSITTIVGLAIGFIPALVLSILSMFIPALKELYVMSYVFYPIVTIILALLIGGTIASFKLDKLYESIVPEKKYAGYDYSNNRRLYKDDVDKFVNTSEILIGKKTDNLKNRKIISEYYNKYKKYIPYEFGIMIIISIIVLFL